MLMEANLGSGFYSTATVWHVGGSICRPSHKNPLWCGNATLVALCPIHHLQICLVHMSNPRTKSTDSLAYFLLWLLSNNNCVCFPGDSLLCSFTVFVAVCMGWSECVTTGPSHSCAKPQLRNWGLSGDALGAIWGFVEEWEPPDIQYVTQIGVVTPEAGWIRLGWLAHWGAASGWFCLPVSLSVIWTFGAQILFIVALLLKILLQLSVILNNNWYAGLFDLLILLLYFSISNIKK